MSIPMPYRAGRKSEWKCQLAKSLPAGRGETPQAAFLDFIENSALCWDHLSRMTEAEMTKLQGDRKEALWGWFSHGPDMSSTRARLSKGGMVGPPEAAEVEPADIPSGT